MCWLLVCGFQRNDGLLDGLFGGTVVAAAFLSCVLLFLRHFFDRIQYHYYFKRTFSLYYSHINKPTQINYNTNTICLNFMESTAKIYISTTLDDKNEQLKLYTVFHSFPSTDHIKSEHLLAEIHLLTQNKSYQAKLRKKNINNQLAWNPELINRLEDVLAGTLNNVFLKIEERGLKNLVLVAANEFEMRSIRVTLFQVELTQLNSPPYELMRTLMKNLHLQRQKTMNNLRTLSNSEKQKLSQIDQYYNQIRQNHKDQISIMKDRFIPVINEAKKKLIKCFGLDPNLEIGRLIDLEGENGQITERKFFKIKETKNNEEAPQKEKVLDVQHLFD